MSDGNYDDGHVYRGKRFVISLFLSFVGIAVVCGFGTFALAQVMKPMLQRTDKAEAEKTAIQRMQKLEGDRPVVR